LKRAESDPEWFRAKWELPAVEDFSTVKLEEPYVLYVMQIWDIVDYYEAEDADIVSSARLMYYGFPLTNKGRYIGSLMIIQNRTSSGEKIIDGFDEFTVGARESAGGTTVQRILELQKQFSDSDGYVICRLETTGLGEYILVRRSERTELITACGKQAGMTLALDEGRERGVFPLVPFDQAAPMLRRAAADIHEAFADRRPVERQ
jgi:hypothetical protein